jgi:hypothetical protein
MAMQNAEWFELRGPGKRALLRRQVLLRAAEERTLRPGRLSDCSDLDAIAHASRQLGEARTVKPRGPGMSVHCRASARGRGRRATASRLGPSAGAEAGP